MSAFKPPPGAQLNLDHPLARGLAGAWLLNEGSGKNAHDYSGQWNEGTLTNISDPPTSTSGWGSGPHGGALIFDASDDYVDVPDTANRFAFPNTTFTVAAWTKAATGGVFAAKDGGGLGVGWQINNSAGQFNAASKGATGAVAAARTSSANISDGGHHHAVAVFKTNTTVQAGNDVTLYVDGKPDQGGLTNTTTYVAPTLPVTFGKRSSGTFMGGGITSVLIYDRALPADEVAWLYAFPYAMFEEPAHPAWMRGPGAPIFMHHYMMQRAA